MNFLEENKGVIIFYIMLAVFTFILVENAKINNEIQDSYVMVEAAKNRTHVNLFVS